MEKILIAPARLKWELMRKFPRAQRLKNRNELGRKRPGEGAHDTSLGRIKRDGAISEIDQVHPKAGLAQPAAGVKAYEEAQPNPFFLARESCKTLLDFIIGELPLGSGFIAVYAKPLHRRNIDVPSQCALSQDLAKHFHLRERGVLTADFVTSAPADAPLDVFVSVAERNLQGVVNARIDKPMANVTPMEGVNSERLRALAVSGEPGIHPCPIVGFPIASSGFALFSEGPLCADDFCLGRIILGIVAKASGLSVNAAVFAVLDPPKRRSRSTIKTRHLESVTV